MIAALKKLQVKRQETKKGITPQEQKRVSEVKMLKGYDCCFKKITGPDPQH
jgi:hypothetical protein